MLGRYAVKKIPVGNDPQWLETKIQEVRALEQFQSHPNVVQYHHAWLEWAKCADFGPEVPTMFLLMQYVNGGSLADRIWDKDANAADPKAEFRKRRGQGSTSAAEAPCPAGLSEMEIWRMLVDMCAGLGHLHEQRVPAPEKVPRKNCPVYVDLSDRLSTPVPW